MRQSLGRFPKGKWPFSLHGGRMDERIRQRCASSVCTRLPPRKGSVAFGDKGIAAIAPRFLPPRIRSSSAQRHKMPILRENCR